MTLTFGVIGGGSWATAIVKILSDTQDNIFWWMRNEQAITHIKANGNNPNYLSTMTLPSNRIELSSDIVSIVGKCDCIILATPSAYIESTLSLLPENCFENKYVISAVKGIVPQQEKLIHDFLLSKYLLPVERFFAVLGPCHSEEVALEKLSYLTICGKHTAMVDIISKAFKTSYIHTRQTSDYIGTQYAAILKNIYSLGGGIAHGLGYGVNFLSVFFANCAREIFYFLKNHPDIKNIENLEGRLTQSVYLGDFLVTAYSSFSRNREFGIMVGLGNTAEQTKTKMSMTAEGYITSQSLYKAHLWNECTLSIFNGIYDILWNNTDANKSFRKIEKMLI